MNRALRALAPASIFLSLVAACASTPAPRTNLMDRTVAGQNRCTVAKSHDRPFVVEWDATDLAQFEAQAKTDVVVVHYEGCEMKVLYTCKDPSLPGMIGTYPELSFTSGSVEQVDIKDEGELYANLPLGAAALGARVERGDTLHLRYYVSGVATASRDEVYRKDLAAKKGCEGATHFVAAYNVGAFEISATSRDKQSAGVGVAGVGAGGSQTHEEAALKHAGDLKTCVAHDQSACRAPIRLVLRPITEGERSAPSAKAQGGGGATDNDPIGQAAMLKYSAHKKWEAKDPGGCIEDLDRAEALDGAHPHPYLRAHCEGLLGHCESAAKQYRLSLAQGDEQKKLTDAELDRKTASWLVTFDKCKATTKVPQQDELGEAAEKACKEKGEASVTCAMMKRAKDARDAQASQRWPQCVSAAKEIVAKWSTLPFEQPYTALVLKTMKIGALCAAQADHCDVAKALVTEWRKAANPGAARQAEREANEEYAKIAACAGK